MLDHGSHRIFEESFMNPRWSHQITEKEMVSYPDLIVDGASKNEIMAIWHKIHKMLFDTSYWALTKIVMEEIY